MSSGFLSLVIGGVLSCALSWLSSPLENEPFAGGRVRAKTKPGAKVELKAEPVDVVLEPAGEAAKGLREVVKALEPTGKLHLVLLGPGTDAPPGVLYGVYLDLPPNATAEQKSQHAVGVLNFFNFIGYEPEDAKNTPNRRAVSLDITEVAKRLRAEGKLRDKPVLTIAPIGKPKAGAKPVVGEIKLVESGSGST